MGCDIHCFGEKKIEDDYVRQYVGDFFDWRSYGLYGFLGNVRNYSAITPATCVHKNTSLPVGVCHQIKDSYRDWREDAHNLSWVRLDNLLMYDYDQLAEDRRCTINGNGGSTCAVGLGKILTLREFLGEGYFEELQRAWDLGVERFIFWFDN